MSDIKFPALEELEGRIKGLQDRLHVIFDEAGPEIDLKKVKSLTGDSTAKAEEIRKINDELTDLGKQRDQMKAVHAAAQRVRTAGIGGQSGADTDTMTNSGLVVPGTKTIGQLFTESVAFKEKGAKAHLDIELKTLFQRSAGFEPESVRTGRIVPKAERPVQVTDVLPSTVTSQAAVVYMEETVLTNNAAEAAEGGAYGEAALALEQKSSVVQKVAVFIPVTDEQLEDEPQARGYINNRLPFMLRQRLDGQILNGNGTSPNLRGLLNVVGIQTHAKGTDPIPDAVHKAMTKVRVVGRAIPDAVVFNPYDWELVRLLRTADGIYIWGNPADAGPERIWGLTVTQGDVLAAGTSVVGDFGNFSELAIRRGIDVQISNSHSDYFTTGKQAVRADLRAALVWYRPAAFCTVTGVA